MDSDSKDPLLTDVNNKFISCMEQFQKSTKVSIMCTVCLYTGCCVLLLVHVCSVYNYNWLLNQFGKNSSVIYKQVINDLSTLPHFSCQSLLYV